MQFNTEVEETPGERRPTTFRSYLIQSNRNVHIMGLVMGVGVAAAAALQGSHLGRSASSGGSGSASRADVTPALCMLVTYGSLLCCANLRPEAYVRRFEVMCELANWVAFFARHASLAGGNPVWEFLRPGVLLGGMLSMRFELRKQKYTYLARMAVDVALNTARLRALGTPGWDIFIWESLALVGKVVLLYAAHYWVESNTLRSFQRVGLHNGGVGGGGGGGAVGGGGRQYFPTRGGATTVEQISSDQTDGGGGGGGGGCNTKLWGGVEEKAAQRRRVMRSLQFRSQQQQRRTGHTPS